MKMMLIMIVVGELGIIITSNSLHGSPWPSSATLHYSPSLPGGLPRYILYWHSAAVYRCKRVVHLSLIHVKGVCRSISLLSSSLLLLQFPVCLVRLTWIVSVMGSRCRYSSCFVASRTCSVWLAEFLSNCRQGFTPYV